MEKITLPAHAKINLALDILGLQSGYHLIQTVYQQIDLHDNVTIGLTDEGITCEGKLATQAAEKFLQHAGRNKGVKITIEKNIPYYSGLGGASSNAAAVLKGLNEIFESPLSQDELMQIGTELGMDVPFFVSGYETALGTHFGEKIEKLPSCPKLKYELYFPDLKKSSTKDMYAQLDLSKCGKDVEKTEKLLEGLRKSDKQIILENTHNDFDQLWERPRQLSVVSCQLLLAGAGPTWIKFSE